MTGRVVRQAALEWRILARNGEQVLLTVIIPVALFLGLALTDVIDLGEPRLELALAGSLAVAVLSSAFTSVAIGTGFDRRSGALLLLATTPLSRRELLVARAAATYGVVAVQVFLLAGLALVLGWRPDAGLLSAFALLVVGTAALGALGFMVAGLLRAEATLAVANGLFLILLFAGGTALPLDSLPDLVGQILRWLPSAALGDGLRAALAGTAGSEATAAVLADLGILAAWAAGAAAIAGRTFRWD